MLFSDPVHPTTSCQPTASLNRCDSILFSSLSDSPLSITVQGNPGLGAKGPVLQNRRQANRRNSISFIRSPCNLVPFATQNRVSCRDPLCLKCYLHSSNLGRRLSVMEEKCQGCGTSQEKRDDLTDRKVAVLNDTLQHCRN